MNYLKLMRIKHYIKNFFVFIPLIFSYSFIKSELVFKAILAFVAFCLVSSVVYILNDIVDVEKDRQHPKKKNRPLASGAISISQAIILALVLSSIVLALSWFLLNPLSMLILVSYFLMNLAYSFKLKNVPLIDVFIISIGFILRVYTGAAAIQVEVSEWLLLTTFAISLFLGFGKRYGEKQKCENTGTTRVVLAAYNVETLRYFMIISMTLTIVFYSLYTILGNTILHNAILTIPFVVLGIFRYYMLLESNIEDGDPTEVILNDRILQCIVVIYGILLGILIFI